MDTRTIFYEVFNHLQSKYGGFELQGTIVYFNGEAMFNTDGFNLEYNLYRLTKILKDNGIFY